MDPDQRFFNDVLSRGTEFKGGPSDLSKLKSGKPWNDREFSIKYGHLRKDYWNSKRDLGMATTSAHYLMGCFFGTITDLKADELVTTWKLVNACSTINEEYVYPEGDSDLTPPGGGGLLRTLATIQFQKTGTLSQSSINSGNISHTLDTVNKWIGMWKGKIETSEREEVSVAINLTSYLMDTLFRVCQKECCDVSAHIMTRSKDTFNSVTTSDMVDPFPPHDYGFSEKFSNLFSAQQKRSKDRVAALTLLMMDNQSDLVRGWLSATCILSLSGTALGLIQWYSKMCQTLEQEPEVMAERMMMDPLFRGLRRLYEWGEIMNPSEVSWMWARILDQGALVEYSVARNVKFCLVCALIVFDCKPDRVKEIAQFRGRVSGIDALVPIALALTNVGNGLGDSCRALGKATEVKAEMIRLRGLTPSTPSSATRHDDNITL